MSLEVAPDIENIITNKVQSGLYQSVNDLIIEALTLLDRQQAFKMHVDHLIDEAEDSFREGRFLTSSQFKSRMNNLVSTFENAE